MACLVSSRASRRGVAFTCVVAASVSGCASTLRTPRAAWRSDGPVSVAYAGAWPSLPATVSSPAGRRTGAQLVLDTGCEGVALSTSLVAALELTRAQRYVSYQGSPVEKGGVGRGHTLTHVLAQMDLGVCQLEGGEAIAVRMPAGLDALAGLAAFQGRAVVLDPERARVTFVPPEAADLLVQKKGAVPLAARRIRNTLRVRVQVGPRAEADLLIDTGARYSWVSPAIARSAGQRDVVQGRVTSAGADLGVRTLMVESDGDLEGALGSDVLLGLGRPVLLDLERSRVVLLPPASAAPPAPRPKDVHELAGEDPGPILIRGKQKLAPGG